MAGGEKLYQSTEFDKETKKLKAAGWKSVGCVACEMHTERERERERETRDTRRERERERERVRDRERERERERAREGK